MDELEISGKRYISTRRAAKEYKYHSDYIGQLIRGKKLLGRKVGRSWYVELDSAAEYFGKEGRIEVAPLVAKAVVEAEPTVVEVAPEEVLATVAEPVVMQEKEVIEESKEKISEEDERPVLVEIKKERDSIHIPVRVQRPSFEAPAPKRSTLTYINDEADDAEFVPLAYPSRKRPSLATTSVMPRSEDELRENVEQESDFADTNYIESEEEFSEAAPIRKNKMALLGVGALGILVLMAVVGTSLFLNSHTVIEAGKGATAGYSLQ